MSDLTTGNALPGAPAILVRPTPESKLLLRIMQEIVMLLDDNTMSGPAKRRYVAKLVQKDVDNIMNFRRLGKLGTLLEMFDGPFIYILTLFLIEVLYTLLVDMFPFGGTLVNLVRASLTVKE